VGPAGRSLAASASPGAGAEPRAAARQIAYRTRAARSPLLLPTRTLRAISATATQGLPFRDGPRERHDRPRGREHLLLRNLHSLAGGMGGRRGTLQLIPRRAAAWRHGPLPLFLAGKAYVTRFEAAHGQTSRPRRARSRAHPGSSGASQRSCPRPMSGRGPPPTRHFQIGLPPPGGAAPNGT